MKKKFKIIDVPTGEKFKLSEGQMTVMNSDGVFFLVDGIGEELMAYTEKQYKELENRCNGWRQLCYKHEQTICDLKYQIVCLEASQEPQSPSCPGCKGTGISSYVNHGHGEDSVEAIKCESCEGFGYT